MNAQTIISNFNTYTDDMSELSSGQEYALLNKKYKEWNNERAWEYLRKSASVAVTNNEIALPADFKNFCEDFTEREAGYGQGMRFLFWVGNIPYPIVNMKDRRNYRDSFSYVDIANKKIVCQDTNIAGLAEFDYLHKPADLIADAEPIFSEDYHPVLYHMMAIDHEIIDQSEKARSMRAEHQAAITKYTENATYEYGQFEEDFTE